jgi:hypothetical protein
LLSFAAICLFFSAVVNAQSYAITNAKVVTVSGATIEKGTVVIRNGLIEAVGANLMPPADAQVFDAAGLTVYPGFIDTSSNLGLAAPRPATPGPGGPGGGGGGQQQQQAAAQAQSISNFRVGLRPEVSVMDDLLAGDAPYATARNAGFTTAVTVGRTGVFHGRSAVINLAGDSVSSLIVRSPFAQHISMASLGGGGGGAGGGYPVSLLGTFSAMRQMFNDARRLHEIRNLYAQDPRGMKRPEADPSLEALLPVVNRQMPVVINANREIEIIRALDFIKEFNLIGIIAGGQEAWKVTDRLKAQNVPVLLSLNFPKRTTAASPDADGESLEMLRFRAETPKTAARLAQAGIKFAFQSGGATALNDVFASAGKSVENGLSRDAAIRAMTLGAAEILGIADRTGSIETGKIANLVVIKGDIFGTDRFAPHIFVDGKHFEQKETPRPAGGRGPGGPAGAGAAAPNISGSYAITIDVPGQPVAATLTLIQQGPAVSGSMALGAATSQLRDGRVTGSGFSFVTSVTFEGTSIDITVSGTVSGSQVSGTVDSPLGTVPFSGTKNP